MIKEMFCIFVFWEGVGKEGGGVSSFFPPSGKQQNAGKKRQKNGERKPRKGKIKKKKRI